MTPSLSPAGLLSERVARPDGIGETTFDEQLIYRYRLSRLWNEAAPDICWIMLNPSSATAAIDDRTIARVVGFSKSWGWGSVVVVNLFAFRTRWPDTLNEVSDPVGPDNDAAILEVATSTSRVIAAWGNHGTIVNPATGAPRGEEVRGLLASAGIEPDCLRVTAHGQPGHPLYLPASAAPAPLGQSVASSPARIS